MLDTESLEDVRNEYLRMGDVLGTFSEPEPPLF